MELPWFKTEISNDVVSTIVLLVFVGLLRIYLREKIFRWKFANPQLRIKWFMQVRILCFGIGILGLLFIWGPELKEFALSVTALAAAMVLATKELILCFMGGILKASNHMFTVGDRIVVDEFHGDVIDHSFLTTRLREIGPGQSLHQYTGREVVIPNSLLLSNAVINESELGPFTLHTFSIPLEDLKDLDRYEKILLDSANEITHTFKKEASNSLTRISFQEGVDTPSVEPRISIKLTGANRADLFMRVAVPTKRKGKIEQDITRVFISKLSTATPTQTINSN